MGFWGSEANKTDRLVVTNDFSKNKHFCNNRVVNSKYTIITFLPLILYAHLKRFMNMYFIMVGIVQLWDAVTPVNPITMWAPIVLIFAITFIREGYDDILRHREDKKVNEKKFKIIRNGEEKIVKSESIYPGDILMLERDVQCPCDICLLYTSSHDGKCCIETANLDGETNLKERYSLKSTQELSMDALKTTHIWLRCPVPNHELYSFDSHLYVGTLSNDNINIVSESQLIQMGVFLKNADYVYGLVCYTGKETKLSMNAQKPPIKWTQIEKFLDKAAICIFIAQLILAGVAGGIGIYVRDKLNVSEPYLHFELDNVVPQNWMWLIILLRCYLLTTIMIPVSFKVTIDVCKYIYAIWIRNDRQMYDIQTKVQMDEKAKKKLKIANDENEYEQKGIRAQVSNTSVIEDLGVVEYMFTDKTGTLTMNEMILKKLSVGNKFYGHHEQYDDILDDQFFVQDVENKDNDVLEAIYCLSVCHTLKIIYNDDKVNYEGVSPEEMAFLGTLNKLNIKVKTEDNYIRISSDALRIPETTFEILSTLPFSFQRKRMSVIVKNIQTGDIKMYMKGAHEMVVSRCSTSYDLLETQMVSLSSSGLRVMALAMKDLTEGDLKKFNDSIDHANQETLGRKEAVNRAYEDFEVGMSVIGLTGIEDRLQDDVPRTIEMLRKANIRIWMVTGDLMNTAIKIAQTTKLISSDGPLIHLSTERSGYEARTLLKMVTDYVDSLYDQPFYLVIEGSSSGTAHFLTDCRKEFAQLASRARSVICARTIPKQKALFVEAIKSLGNVTLAIGDGGNDVTMLRSAHIGVGIMGKEGSQAAVASDFAFTQFKYLQRLILIHGRYSAYRTAWLTQFCFYKAIVLALIQVAYMLFNGYSGISFVNDFNLMCYNAIFTILPVIFFLFDKDVDDTTILLNPRVYVDTQKGTFINVRTLFWWIVRGIYQAVVIVLIVFNTYNIDFVNEDDGTPANLAEAQQVSYSILILIVTVTTTMDTQTFTALNFIFIWGNWVLYIFIGILANLIADFSITRSMYLVMWHVLSDPVAWLTVVIATAMAVLPVNIIQSIFSTYLPTRTQQLRLREIRKGAKFEPTYLTRRDNKGNIIEDGEDNGIDEGLPEASIYETTSNIFAPLVELTKRFCC